MPKIAISGPKSFEEPFLSGRQPQIDDILDHDIEGLIVEGYSEGYSLRALDAMTMQCLRLKSADLRSHHPDRES